jgi:hypothetical protein
MNKKIVIGSIIAVSMLMIISFTSAVSTNKNTNVERKESPLFGIRTKQAINEKINLIIENIKARFIGERIFCVPIKLFRNIVNPEDEYYSCTDCYQVSCDRTSCRGCTFGDKKSPCTVVTCDQDTSWITCAGLTCNGISILCCP